jgi:peptide/nickel transport system substrate-binding protein
LNTKHPLLRDKTTRQALACLTDVPKMINTIKYGNAKQVVGPVHPSKKKEYDSSIQLYSFDLEKAKELLEKAGWKNTNGDETLDKMIDGKRTEFVIDFIINAGNDERKSIALMFQEQAKKVGITVNVLTLDWAVFLGKSRNHEFAINIGKWISGPAPDELKSTFHSTSASGEGSNFSNYSNVEADALMDSIRTEIDENKREPMYHRLQEIFHDEVPMIFLYAPTEHIAISKKFDNAYPSVARPGYWVPGFQILKASAQ